MPLKLEVLFYIFSLAFQVAGAVLLIIKYWGKTKERIIDEYFPGSNIAERDKDNNVILKKEIVQSCAQKVYDNRMAFLFIAIGYVLSIFGTLNEGYRLYVLALVVVSTVIIILLEKGISIFVSKRIYNEDIILPYSKVEHIADTIITASEIEELFTEASE